MPKTLDEVARDAAMLTDIERLKLARLMLDLTDSADTPSDDVEQAWDQEIERRLEELRNGSAITVPFDDVKEKLRQMGHLGPSM